MENSVEAEEPFWINPCGLADEPDSLVWKFDPKFGDPALTKEALNNSQRTVNVALIQAKDLLEYLVSFPIHFALK